MFGLLNVNPPGEHPIFTWLKGQSGGAGALKWNFEKFLVGRDGTFLGRWRSQTDPQGKEITSAIEKALSGK